MTFIPDFKISRTLIMYGGNYGDFAGPIGQIALQDIYVITTSSRF